MTIDIGKLRDGSLAVISNEPFPATVRHIEYYKDQRLFQIIFNRPDTDPLLITQELDAKGARYAESAPDMMIVVMAEGTDEPFGYEVPLIQIGV
jgi:hypothetical protein